MAKTAICIDDWKLDIFREALNDAGYIFHLAPGVAANTFTLRVDTDDIDKLTQVIKMANERAALEKKNLH